MHLPELRVIDMSGYVRQVVSHHRFISPGDALLEKPLTRDTLLAAVYQALETQSSG